MVSKMELVAQLHESLFKNVDRTQKKQEKTYVARKGLVMFHSFEDGKVSIKMRKPNKNKSFLASWERPWPFCWLQGSEGMLGTR